MTMNSLRRLIKSVINEAKNDVKVTLTGRDFANALLQSVPDNIPFYDYVLQHMNDSDFHYYNCDDPKSIGCYIGPGFPTCTIFMPISRFINPADWSLPTNYMLVLAFGNDYSATGWKGKSLNSNIIPEAPDGGLALGFDSFNSEAYSKLTNRRSKIVYQRTEEELSDDDHLEGFGAFSLKKLVSLRMNVIVHEYSHDMDRKSRQESHRMTRDRNRAEIRTSRIASKNNVDNYHLATPEARSVSMKTYMTAKTEINAYTRDAFIWVLDLIKMDHNIDPINSTKQELLSIIPTPDVFWEIAKEAIYSGYTKEFDEERIEKIFKNRLLKMWETFLRTRKNS